ncbi:MAG: hypothetical protein KKF44_02250, partial [Nanoarchaeota archaeon]|nr:hypothetical protein [Nanoarchaeota archaeon]
KDYRKALEFIKENIPEIISMNMKKSYAKRFFYTMAGFYKDDMGYDSLTYLYELSHKILRIA